MSDGPPQVVTLRPSTAGWSGGEDLVVGLAEAQPAVLVDRPRVGWLRRALRWAWRTVLLHMGAPR